MEFKDRLKELRQEKEQSLEDVAQGINKQFGTNLNRSTVLRYETGECDPKVTVASYFAKFYGVSMDYLIGLVDDKQGKYGPDYIVNGMIIETLPTHPAGHRTVQAKPRIEDEENIG